VEAQGFPEKGVLIVGHDRFINISSENAMNSSSSFSLSNLNGEWGGGESTMILMDDSFHSSYFISLYVSALCVSLALYLRGGTYGFSSSII
jgi:hypothetical protein